MEVKDKVQPSGAGGKKAKAQFWGKMYKRLNRQEMAIADKSFEYQDKRSGEMNVSK